MIVVLDHTLELVHAADLVPDPVRADLAPVNHAVAQPLQPAETDAPDLVQRNDHQRAVQIVVAKVNRQNDL